MGYTDSWKTIPDWKRKPAIINPGTMWTIRRIQVKLLLRTQTGCDTWGEKDYGCNRCGLCKTSLLRVRRITEQLHRDGEWVNHKRVARLMQILGIEAIYPKPNLSKNANQHPYFPYLLKNTVITRPNQVWGIDITYIRLQKDWLYLVALLIGIVGISSPGNYRISCQSSFVAKRCNEHWR